MNRGDAWFSKGENDRALADYDEAIRLAPKDHEIYGKRGAVWRAKGDTERAHADDKRALDLMRR